MRLPLRHVGILVSASSLAILPAAPAAAADDHSEAASSEAAEANEAPPPASVGSAGARIFSAADFTRFAPRTALDMVRQIPGFSIDGGNQGARGLGQASQNILLNGQRVSGKSNDARSTLTRIDAADVERIEVVDGATLDIPGLSGQVANIIYKANNFGGTFEWQPQWRQYGNSRFYAGAISFNGRLGKTEWTASLSNNNNAFRDFVFGPERRFDPSGNLIATKKERASFHGDRPRLSASISRTADNGNILNLNGAAEIWRFRQRFGSFVTRDSGDEIFDLSLSGENEWNAELGGDYEFALGPGRLKLIALQRNEHSEFRNDFRSIPADDPDMISTSRFPQTVDESESIARGEYRWNALGGDWQVSLEGAYNRLESEAGLFVSDPGGPEREIAVPGANAIVDEKRAELILTHSRELATGLTAQLNIGGEFSDIGVDGEAAEGRRQFFRPKGSFSVAWRAADGLRINAEVSRIVDQLNFFDFLASVDLVNDQDRADNPELVPPQRWRFEVEATKSLGSWGTLNPRIRYEIIEDVVEAIPVSPTAEALGNLPRATRLILTGEGTILFDPIGWEGAKLDFELEYIGSDIEDPLTGENRELRGQRDLKLEFRLRHDVPGTDLAWGGSAEYREYTANLRLDEESQFREGSPMVGLFVEHKDVAGLTVRGSLYNLLNRKNLSERTVYVDRRDGPVAFSESFRRNFGLIGTLTISGSL